MTTRRDFFKEIGLGLSAMVFTPSIIRPSWRDTLRFNQKFFPHWVVLRPEWIAARYFEDHYSKHYESNPELRIEAQQQYDCYVKSVTIIPDFLFLRYAWGHEVMGNALSPSGVVVEPYIHLPKNFTPPSIQRI